MSDLNLELFGELLETINTRPKQVDMGLWMFDLSRRGGSLIYDCDSVDRVDDFVYQGVVPYALHSCNTAGCACGWAIYLRPAQAREIRQKLIDKTRPDYCHAEDPTNEETATSRFFVKIGATLYGLTEEQATVLFFSYNWPSEYSAMSEQEGLAAIVTRIITEQSAEFLVRERRVVLMGELPF